MMKSLIHIMYCLSGFPLPIPPPLKREREPDASSRLMVGVRREERPSLRSPLPEGGRDREGAYLPYVIFISITRPSPTRLCRSVSSR
jgi:hypothetical protein